jgi:hypothetical protein
MAKGKKARGSDQKARPFSWIPRWGWVLIFLVPLLMSEYMFYRVGRTASMVLFPVAWVAFWITLMQRSGWAVFRGREEG